MIFSLVNLMERSNNEFGLDNSSGRQGVRGNVCANSLPVT